MEVLLVVVLEQILPKILLFLQVQVVQVVQVVQMFLLSRRKIILLMPGRLGKNISK